MWQWSIVPHCTGLPPAWHETWGILLDTTPCSWDPRTLQSPTSDIWWSSLKTCSNLLIRPLCTTPSRVTSDGHLKSYGQRNRAVRILLECFLRALTFIKYDGKEENLPFCFPEIWVQFAYLICGAISSCALPFQLAEIKENNVNAKGFLKQSQQQKSDKI